MTNTDIINASKIMIGSVEAEALYIGNNLIWNSLPYDIEIEYLLSSSEGGQFIDLGIYPTSNSHIIVDAQYSDITSLDNIGTLDGASSRFLVCCIYLGYFHFGLGTDWINAQAADTNRHMYEVYGNGVIKIDSNNYLLNNDLLLAVASLYIFGVHNRNEERYSKSFRIYSLKFYEENQLLLDLIPVRVGQVGYFYNKVNKLLIGNNGTGDFVLGPDK